MANKKLIWIGVASVILIGGGLFWWYKTKNSGEVIEKESEKESVKESKKEDEKEEDKSRNEEKLVKNETVSTSTSLPPTPFNNTIEGNVFRVWMSVNHPTYRYKKEILDKSGSYDNSFMRDAYSKFGSEFTSKTKSLPLTNQVGLRKGQLLFIKLPTSSIYKYPEIKGQYLLGSLNKSWLLDKSFGKFIERAGNGFIKFETIAYVPNCPPNAKCTGRPIVTKQVAFIPSVFVSDKPY